MNRQAIRNMSRSWLNESAAGFWTDAELNSWIDLANQKLNRTIISYDPKFFTISSTFPTVANTKAYTLPIDFQKMVRLEHYSLTDASDIEKIDEIAFPRTEQQGLWPSASPGKPKRYFIRSNQMEFIPISDDVYNIRIYYDNAKADLILDTDIPASPSDFHDMIALWTAYYAVPKNQGDHADNLLAMYSRREEDFLEALMGRGGDDMENVESYLGGLP